MTNTPRINPNFTPSDASFVPALGGESAPDFMAWADLFYPDDSLPESVRDAMTGALDRRHGAHYTLPIGEGELRAALAEKLRAKNGFEVHPDRNIVVTPGSDTGLFFAMLPFVQHGDEVLVPDPSYVSNRINVGLLGGVAVRVELDAADSYRLDTEAFRAKVTERTRMILLTHPNNPTTTVFRRDDLEKLAELIVEKNLILIVDQAFEDHVFDEIEFVSPAALQGLWDRTVTVFSFSKGYGLSGLRVGYLVSNEYFTSIFQQHSVFVLGATSTLSQAGALAALTDEKLLPETFAQLDRRRAGVLELFAAVPGVRVTPMESGFFVWVDVTAIGGGAEVKEHVLRTANAEITDGAMFGVTGAGFVRISYGTYKSDDKALAACARIAHSMAELAHLKGVS